MEILKNESTKTQRKKKYVFPQFPNMNLNISLFLFHIKHCGWIMNCIHYYDYLLYTICNSSSFWFFLLFLFVPFTLETLQTHFLFSLSYYRCCYCWCCLCCLCWYSYPLLECHLHKYMLPGKRREICFVVRFSTFSFGTVGTQKMHVFMKTELLFAVDDNINSIHTLKFQSTFFISFFFISFFFQ